MFGAARCVGGPESDSEVLAQIDELPPCASCPPNATGPSVPLTDAHTHSVTRITQHASGGATSGGAYRSIADMEQVWNALRGATR